MKYRKCLILVLSLMPLLIKGQDTTGIVFSHELDTLVKQRFIDRYENVFMTKVPTRHMVKIGFSQYTQARVFPLKEDHIWNNSSLQLGYEFKFLPAFSIALSGHMPFYGTDVPIRYAWQNTVMDAQLRWFFNMADRVRSGRGASNFSGNYLAINYTLPGTLDFTPTIGLKLGFQQRFLNAGFMDFAIALQQETPFFHYGLLYNWSFSSQVSFGLAFGDWKKSARIPLCDLLLCDEYLTDQWKIKLPELTVGAYLSRIKLGMAYERKMKSSPFSLNVQFDSGLNNGYNYMRFESRKPRGFYGKYRNARSREINAAFSIQPRYYFLQKRQRLRGKAGNGFSGIYTGVNTEYNLYLGKHNYLQSREVSKMNDHIFRAGPLLGFQQRLFSHGYVDFNTSYNFQGYANSTETSFTFKGNLTIGFAF